MRARRGLKLLGAVLLGGVVYAMTAAVDAGLTRSWSQGARYAWAAVAGIGSLAAVLLLANASGGLTGASLRERGNPEGRVPSLSVFIATYVGVLVVAVSSGLYAHARYGLASERVMVVMFGGCFLLGSSGRPWWWYETVRRLGWFSAIQSDAAMRVLLATIGAACVLGGLFYGVR